MSPWRFVIPLGLLVALLCPPSADAFPAPQPRFGPFDLGYLPETRGKGILALRPAAISKHYSFDLDLIKGMREMWRLVIGQWFGANQAAVELPALSDIEECVVGCTLTFTGPSEQKRGCVCLSYPTPWFVRTVKPFDWAGAVKALFPDADPHTIAGLKYYRVGCKLPIAEGNYLGFYVADERSLVVGPEDDLRQMLRRLREGKHSLTPPPGWEAVERDLIAIALPADTMYEVKDTWPVEPPEEADLRAAVEHASWVTGGLSIVGSRTDLRLAIHSRDPAFASTVAGSTGKFLALWRQELEGKNGAASVINNLLESALKRVTVHRDGSAVLVRATMEGDILAILSEETRKLDQANESRVVHAGNFPTNPGTTWVYKRSDGTQLTQGIMRSSKDGADTLITLGVKGDGADQSLSESATYRVTKGGLLNLTNVKEDEDPKMELQFPLRSGVNWITEYKVLDLDATDSCRVFGPEEIKVPAGSFNAMRVVIVSLVGESPRGTAVWYAPKVGVIKWQNGDDVLELQSFTAGKDGE